MLHSRETVLQPGGEHEKPLSPVRWVYAIIWATDTDVESAELPEFRGSPWAAFPANFRSEVFPE